MALVAGAKLGPYEIIELIGAGGMGEVYRARDTRLARDVAIKVSTEQFTNRFEREARAVAQLNHPHICTLHDVGPNYLVMELVEGETLSRLLKKGALPVDRVVQYGAQIADALAAAHAEKIVHRDLKPGNLMICRGGVKVLDFGLAKTPQDETVTLTNAVKGTPAYMAPEQRAGKECDARTDIFSFGLVLYEMAAGQRPAPGQMPDMTCLAEKLGHVIARCLARDPDQRWQSASDVKHELLWSLQSPASAQSEPVRRVGARWPLAIVIAAVLAAGLGWAIGYWRRPAVQVAAMRLAIDPPPGADLRGDFAVSPDGRLLVFNARSGGVEQLWLRPLNSRAARELLGTEGAAAPFWSPDSRSIAFFAAGKLKRLDISGGLPRVICDVGLGRGGTWNAEGTILFNSVNDGPILRVSSDGGQPAPVTQVDTAHQENSHRWPFFLPDGRRFLFFVLSANLKDGPGTQGVYLGSVDPPQERSLLIRSSTNAVFALSEDRAPGYLLWIQEGTLMARLFDARRGQFRGQSIPAAEMVNFSLPARLADISVSNDGTLVYRSASKRQYQLTWTGRDGKPTGTLGPPDVYQGLRISPDGGRVAASRITSGLLSVALIETARGIATPLVANAFGDVWSPDGMQMAYTTSQSGNPNLYVRSTTGAGEPERLTNSRGSQMVLDWSADGHFLLYSENVNDPSAPAGADLWILPLSGDRKPFAFLTTPYRENHGRFSPDGRWIAYDSDELGHPEVYVQSFPAGRGKWQVSNKGGDFPRWRRDGRELFYVGPDGILNAVTVKSSQDGLEFGPPLPLFRITVLPANGPSYPFDIAPDGRILALTPAAESGDSSLIIALHWQTELKH